MAASLTQADGQDALLSLLDTDSVEATWSLLDHAYLLAAQNHLQQAKDLAQHAITRMTDLASLFSVTVHSSELMLSSSTTPSPPPCFPVANIPQLFRTIDTRARRQRPHT